MTREALAELACKIADDHLDLVATGVTISVVLSENAGWAAAHRGVKKQAQSAIRIAADDAQLDEGWTTVEALEI
jgi:hypothetical protein